MLVLTIIKNLFKVPIPALDRYLRYLRSNFVIADMLKKLTLVSFDMFHFVSWRSSAVIKNTWHAWCWSLTCPIRCFNYEMLCILDISDLRWKIRFWWTWARLINTFFSLLVFLITWLVFDISFWSVLWPVADDIFEVWSFECPMDHFHYYFVKFKYILLSVFKLCRNIDST